MIAKLQQFVQRMVEDEAFRDTAARDPEAAVAVYGLTGADRHGALKLCTQMAGPTKIHSDSFWV